jgi:capsular polysaccharide biosynthesis protein
LVALVATASAIGVSLLQTPVYEASITILVGQKATDTNTPLSADVTGLQDLTQTVADTVGTRPVARSVVEQLGLPEGYTETLLEDLSAEPDPGTLLVSVSYDDPDPERARLIANTTGSVFSERISEVSPGANAITATVWEQAVLPEAPVGPDPLRNALIALLLGTFLGVGLAFLLEYLDDSWNSPEEVERISGVPTFGVVPEFKDFRAKRKDKR